MIKPLSECPSLQENLQGSGGGLCRKNKLFFIITPMRYLIV